MPAVPSIKITHRIAITYCMCILRLALGCVAMELKRSSVPERMLAHLASRALNTTKNWGWPDRSGDVIGRGLGRGCVSAHALIGYGQ